MDIDQTILQKVNEYFHDNESTKQYLDIISTALERQKYFQHIINNYAWGTLTIKKKTYFDFYNEMHHIIPISIDKELEKYKPNWVVLTAQEHFTVHKLLVDMCISKRHYFSMCRAFDGMCKMNNGLEVTAEEYALAVKLAVEAKEEPVECYIKVDGEEIILGKFKSHGDAADKTNGNKTKIGATVRCKRYSSGTYNIKTKQYNENKFGSSSILPNNKYPSTYRLYWREENSTSTITITPKELIECFIIVDDKEVILDRFVSSYEAQDKTHCHNSAINAASNSKINYSGTYNLSTKLYNERMFGGNSILPNNKYPTTYKCYWRKENSQSTITITPIELYECYIEVNGREIILDRFVTSLDAADETKIARSSITKASIGKVNSSGTYNIDTKQYNENKFGSSSILPNNKYPSTYKCQWRKIKE